MRGRVLSVKGGLALAIAALFAMLLANGCTAGGNVPVPDSGVIDAAPNPCGPGTAKMCGGTCVDVQSDFQNCGDCGVKCESDKVCSHGTCAVVCGGGTARCGNNCVDLKADPANCGGCGSKCSGGEVCDKGTCALTCQSPLTDCNGGCVDTQSDDFNCGACGQACPTGKQCVNGACSATCSSPWTSCADGDAGATKCVDVKSDPQNCNGCGNACPQGYFCNNGTCGIQCAGGTTNCNNQCVDESIDSNHCGACGTVCGSGNTCSNAHCCPNTTPYYCGGCDTFANCVTKSGGRIVAGYESTCAINAGGATYCWGYNGDGEVGTGSTTTTEYNTAQAVSGLSSGTLTLAAGENHVCAVTTSGAAKCWGYNVYGQLGTASFNDAYSPTGVSGLSSGVARVAGAGYYATCFALTNGSVKCAGYDYEGLLASGTASFNEYDTPQTTLMTSGITNVGSGPSANAACAITSSGGVECWGEADYGLGDGSSTISPTPVAVSGITGALSVSVGYYNICVVTAANQLKCWGYGAYGSNGNGTTSSTTPVTASISGVVQACTGYGFTCAVTSGGAVQCVGLNSYGALGNGSTNTSTSWVTPIASGAVAVTCGYYHTCALMASGKAECWGYNYDGEVGNGTYTTTSPYGVLSPTVVSGF